MARSRQDRARRSAARSRRSCASTPARSALFSRRLRCEPLEDRRLLALITVTTVDDVVDVNDGKMSLREAVFVTESVAGADEIRFDARLFEDGPQTLLLTQGHLLIRESLAIVGPGAGLLTIDASGSDPTPSVFDGQGSRAFIFQGVNEGISGPLKDWSIDGLALTGGDVYGNGGAILAGGGYMTLTNCLVANNAASNEGGGVWVYLLDMTACEVRDNVARRAGGLFSWTLTVTDSTIAQNNASGLSTYGGGGIMARMATIIDSRITGNSTGGYGGGIQGVLNGAITVRSSEITDNSAAYGGGIAGHRVTIEASAIHRNMSANDGGGVFATGPLEILDSRFSGNRASSAHARGGSVAARDTLTMEGTEISLSRAARGGGAATVGAATITASAIVDNTAYDDDFAAGGGVFAEGELQLINATVTGNAAQVTGDGGRAHGGGVYGEATLTIAHSTVFNNSATSVGVDALGSVGGVFAAGLLTLNHTIVAANLSEDGGDLRFGTSAVTYSVIGDATGTALVEAPIGAPNSNGSLIGGLKHGPIDPMLELINPADGGTQYLEPAFGSPAIAAGSPGDYFGMPEFDQRGAGSPRRQGVRVDIGAVESPLHVYVVDSLADSIGGDSAALTLRSAIALANATPEPDIIEFAPALFANGPATIVLTLGALEPVDDLDIRGPGADLLTIDASGNDPTSDVDNADGSRVFTLRARNLLSGMALTGGDVLGPGGGVRSFGRLELTDVHIVDNFASGSGGGVDVPFVFVMRASQITDNRAQGVGAGLDLSGDVTLERSTIARNRMIPSGSSASVGGLMLNAQNAVIVQCEITENVGLVGGVRFAGGSLFILESTIQANRGTSGGLGVDSGDVEVVSSTIADNVSSQGAAVFLSAGSTARFAQTTISGNEGGYGAVRGRFSELEFVYSTIANNVGTTVDTAAGIDALRLTLLHTIVAGNRNSVGGPLDLRVTEQLAADFSLIGQNSSPMLAEAPVGSPDARGNLVGGPVHGAIDPRLGPLADNGGPTLTHKPLAGSPAIDAGDPALDPEDFSTPQYDQRWAPFARVVGARVDIGAVESIGSPIVVDTLLDESDGDYRQGDLSLREAIELANAQPGADEIVFAAGLFASGPGTILLTRGELVITDSLTITGPGRDVLTIDASGNDPTPEENNGDGSRIFTIDDQNSTQSDASISNVTLTGGDAGGNGGAIVTGENLNLADCWFTSNHSAGSGGGLYIYKLGGDVSIANTEFTGNRASQGGGGVSASAFQGSQIVLYNVQFSENHSMYSGGGALFYASGGSIVIDDSVFDHNVSGHSGGGLMIAANSDIITLQRSTVTNNDSTFGGGVFLYSKDHREFPRGTARMLHVTISGNRASLFGGGVYGFANLGDIGEGGSLEIRHSTITGNSVADTFDFARGGGLILYNHGSGAVVLDHSVVGGNYKGSTQPSDYSSRGIPDPNIIRNSLIGTTDEASLVEAPVGWPDANGNLIGGPIHGPIDPQLGPLADNGGPTPTHMPLPGSPVIGVGDPEFAPGVNGAPEFDQRGAPFTRLAGARIDIGAVEVQAVDGAFGADFNFDGVVNGSDFLVWQRNIGRASGATLRHGDATADGDVDAADLAVWRARADAGAQGGMRGEEIGARSAEEEARREALGAGSPVGAERSMVGQGGGGVEFVSLAQRVAGEWRPAMRRELGERAARRSVVAAPPAFVREVAPARVADGSRELIGSERDEVASSEEERAREWAEAFDVVLAESV